VPTTKPSKHLKRKRGIVKKFNEQVINVREENAKYWESIALPKIKPVNRKPKPKAQKGSHNRIKERLRAISYRQAEERDEGCCVICGAEARQHHHIIRQSTRYGPEYIQRMENIICICIPCHTMGLNSIHGSRGKSDKQTYLEEWQRKYYPEYVQMMHELAKVTGCRDEWLLTRWQQQYGSSTVICGR
jgi:hypothetical protein